MMANVIGFHCKREIIVFSLSHTLSYPIFLARLITVISPSQKQKKSNSKADK